MPDTLMVQPQCVSSSSAASRTAAPPWPSPGPCSPNARGRPRPDSSYCARSITVSAGARHRISQRVSLQLSSGLDKPFEWTAVFRVLPNLTERLVRVLNEARTALLINYLQAPKTRFVARVMPGTRRTPMRPTSTDRAVSNIASLAAIGPAPPRDSLSAIASARTVCWH